MRYLGNKTRLAKYISPFLVRHLNGDNYFIDVFAGAMGMISNIDYPKRMAYDIDRYIISLMQDVRDGWIPPDNYTESDYNAAKEYVKTQTTSAYSDGIIGFLGYGCSFGGKFFNGFARGGTNSKGVPRNVVAETSRNLIRMRPKLQGIQMKVADYLTIDTGEGNVVYADPPYKNTTKYKENFDHDKFWEWCREESTKNFLYISEYTAPSDFISVWNKQHKTGIHHRFTQHKETVENLFIFSNGLALRSS